MAVIFASVMARLKDELSAPAVELVEDIDELANYAGQLDTGAVIVVPLQERAARQSLSTGGHRQRVAMQFLIGVVIRHYDNLLGEARALQFDSHLRAIEAAMAGWEPQGAVSPCELVAGESSPVTKGVSIYVQTWETARFLTGA